MGRAEDWGGCWEGWEGSGGGGGVLSRFMGLVGEVPFVFVGLVDEEGGGRMRRKVTSGGSMGGRVSEVYCESMGGGGWREMVGEGR